MQDETQEQAIRTPINRDLAVVMAVSSRGAVGHSHPCCCCCCSQPPLLLLLLLTATPAVASPGSHALPFSGPPAGQAGAP